jgi:protein-tyrosine sulfotransferase
MRKIDQPSNQMKEPIFILGAHKSGSSLLRSLLDHHPSLFVIPFETHFFQLAGYWVDYRLRQSRPPLLPFPKIKTTYYEHIQLYNRASDAYVDANLVGRFDLQAFHNRINCEEPDTFPELIFLYVKSVYFSLFQAELPDHYRIVEKSVEHGEFAIHLHQMFPDARFIHILRNPYANLVALRRYLGRRKYPILGRLLITLYNSYYHLYQNRQLIQPYLVVRYEDLLQEPENKMRAIAQFLEIEYTDALLKPTSLGQPWQGNSSRDIQFTGISAKNLDIWQRDIKDLEIFYTNRYFKFLLEEYGYPVIDPKGSRFAYIRGEGPVRYFLNRTFQFQI